MRARGLMLALVIVGLPGCFGSHGDRPPAADGGGSVIDGGGACEPRSGNVQSLECRVIASAPGAATVLASITTDPGACCGSGAASASHRVDFGVRQVYVDVAWSACDCDPSLRCVAPTEVVELPIGLDGYGGWAIHAGGASCTVEVPAPAPCRAAPTDGARFPTVIFDDQPFAATATSRSASGCGCQPRIVSASDLRLELCSCCDDCECVDSGYQASALFTLPSVGRFDVVIPHGAATIEVAARSECAAIDPGAITGLRIVLPESDLVTGGERIVWAEVDVAPRLCCVEPRIAIDRGTGPAGELALTAHQCTPDPCDCVGAPRPATQLHALTGLEPGHHVVRAGAHTASFDLP